MMSDTDRQLMVGFLTQNYELFQEYLDEQDIEPSEAEFIIKKLDEE